MTNVLKPRWVRIIIISLIGVIASVPVYAISYKEVTMSVGETKTFYLP